MLQFPPKLIVLGEADLPQTPTKPPPDQPKSGRRRLVKPLDYASFKLGTVTDAVLPVLDIDTPTITQSDGYRANFHFSRLKHHQTENTKTIYMLFPSPEETTGFSFTFTLNVANLLDPILVNFHVKVVERKDDA